VPEGFANCSDHEESADPSLRKLQTLARRSHGPLRSEDPAPGAAPGRRQSLSRYPLPPSAPRPVPGVPDPEHHRRPAPSRSLESRLPTRVGSPEAHHGPPGPRALPGGGDSAASSDAGAPAADRDDPAGAEGGRWWCRMASAELNSERLDDPDRGGQGRRSATGLFLGPYTPQFAEYHYRRVERARSQEHPSGARDRSSPGGTGAGRLTANTARGLPSSDEGGG